MLDAEGRTALREAVRRRLASVAANRDGVTADVDAALVDLDCFGLLVPAAYGGSEADMVDALVVLEELGRAGVPSSHVQTAVVGAKALQFCVESNLAARYLPKVVAGEVRTVTATLDADAGGQEAPFLVAAAPDPGSMTVRGIVSAVAAEPTPDLLFAPVAVTAGETQVPTRWVMVVVADGRVRHDKTPTWGADWVHVFEFDDVTVPDSATLLDAAAEPPGDELLSYGAVAVSGTIVGAIERALDLTLDHANTREQFGQPIGRYQSVQGHCVELAIALQSARAITQRAAMALDASGPDRHRLASAAKAWTNDAHRHALRLAHRVHGAIGFTSEYALAPLSRGEIASRSSFGSPASHRSRIAELLTQESM